MTLPLVGAIALPRTRLRLECEGVPRSFCLGPKLYPAHPPPTSGPNSPVLLFQLGQQLQLIGAEVLRVRGGGTGGG